MFPLFSTCADTMNEGKCTNTDEERCIFGTCLMDGFHKDIEIGYGLVNVLFLNMK